MGETLAIKEIIDCRTTFDHKFGTSYRIDLCFHGNKLAIEMDKNGHSNRSIDYKIKRQKSIEQELACKFIRIDPDKEDFDIFRAINEIFRHIKQSTKKI